MYHLSGLLFLILGFFLWFAFIVSILFLIFYDRIREAYVKYFRPDILKREEQELHEAYTLNEIYYILKDLSDANRPLKREELLFMMERFSEVDYEEIKVDTEECLDRALDMGLIVLSGQYLEVTDKGREYIESYRMRR